MRQNMAHPWGITNRNVPVAEQTVDPKGQSSGSSLVGPEVRTYNCVIMFSIPPEVFVSSGMTGFGK